MAPLPPISLPGLTSIPPLNLGSDASASWGQNGSILSGSGAGDWTVNLGGSGLALQSGSAVSPMILIGLAAVALLLVMKK